MIFPRQQFFRKFNFRKFTSFWFYLIAYFAFACWFRNISFYIKKYFLFIFKLCVHGKKKQKKKHKSQRLGAENKFVSKRRKKSCNLQKIKCSEIKKMYWSAKARREEIESTANELIL